MESDKERFNAMASRLYQLAQSDFKWSFTALLRALMALRAAPEHDTQSGAEAVGTITRSPLLDVEWTDVIQAVKLPIGTKLYTQPAHGELEPIDPDDAAALARLADKFNGLWDELRLTVTRLQRQAVAPTKQPDAEGGQFVVVPMQAIRDLLNLWPNVRQFQEGMRVNSESYWAEWDESVRQDSMQWSINWQLKLEAALPAVPEKKK